MRRFIALVRSFSCEKSGAVAIEFALVSCLYFIPLVAIIFQSIFAYHQANRLDRGVQIVASQIRNGTLMLGDLTTTNIQNSLCIQVAPTLTCSELRPRLYNVTNCSTNSNCWSPFYADYTHGVRANETYNQRFTSAFGQPGDRQLLIVYYPMPMLSRLWDKRTTEVVNGVTYHGIYSAAIWINDPSVGVF